MAILAANVRPVIDLSTNGNTLEMVNMAFSLSKTLELDGRAIAKEITSSDYANAINVFDKYFGDFVDIILPSFITAKDLTDSREREDKKVLQKNLTSEVLAGAYLR